MKAWPYRRLQADFVEAERWQLSIGTSAASPLRDLTSGWDPQAVMRLARVFRLCDGAHESLGIAPDTPLLVAITWRATGSGLRGVAGRWTVPASASFDRELSVELHGDALGGVLTLRTQVVLGHALARLPHRPHLAGSVLWEDEVETRLEGSDPSFPVTIVDFSYTLFDPRAEWHLSIGDDPEAAAMGSLRLYVNSRFAATRDAFAGAASANPAQEMILRSVMSDVRRLMLERGLTLDRDRAWEPGSLGALLVHRLAVDLPGRAPAGLQDMRTAYPHEFDLVVRAETGPVFSVQP